MCHQTSSLHSPVLVLVLAIPNDASIAFWFMTLRAFVREGTIPTDVENLKNLMELDLSSNSFTGG